MSTACGVSDDRAVIEQREQGLQVPTVLSED